MSNLEIGLCKTDLHGKILSLSNSCSGLLGWDTDDLRGRKLYELMPQNQIPMRVALGRAVTRTGQSYNGLSTFLTRDGSKRYVDLTLTRLRSRTGSVCGLLGVWQPINDPVDFGVDPLPMEPLKSPAAEYIASMLREMACLVGPEDERLRAYLISTLKVAMQCDRVERPTIM